jgi:hypothetical protein
MSNGDKVEEKGKEVGEKKEEVQAKQKVELDPEQYNALLDSMAELEALRATKPKKEEEGEDDLDKLAKEGKRGREGEVEKEEPINLDDLTNSQLAQVILKEIDKRNEERLNPLEVTVETLRVLREIDKAERDHNDFWQFEGKVKSISIANPSLSIEDCYLLAKSKTPAKKEVKEGEHEEVPTTRTERLLKLPPRVHGERPGMAVSSTEHVEKGKTLRSAAEKAWDDTIGKGKTSI